MATIPSSLPPPSSTAAERAGGRGAGAARGEGVATLSVAAEVRSQQNNRILQASLEVSISVGNDSQALLFRSAIEKINEMLGTEQVPDALQKAASQDNSPEATADRILSFATGLFASYSTQHPGADQATLAADFVELVRGGFQQGFDEAVDILKGLKVFEGGIAEGIQKTYDLVMKGFDDFLASLTGSSGTAAAPEAATAADAAGGVSSTKT
ncbi:hypothetical protein dqs_1372 [Azoarcus olearius]|uniref:DUF5610 domain-containing protein n=1 Tax=Azoarcus sp. (strain BH72) TaxID=418699 RepID=UPI0008063D81|nr:DUF5610 domain-containing protein [Azoarcus olearius]ANQ84425.1 hypothetical protein dqs_1372 [Azoarcus olearius]